MQIIKNNQDKYNTIPVNAIITKNTIIPGIVGKKVNINKSYNKMKSINKFNESLLVFDEIKPLKSINNYYDKVIVSGNKRFNKISIIINSKDYENEIKKISIINNTNLDINNDDYCFTDTLYINKDCLINKKHTILTKVIDNYHLTKTKEILQNGVIINYRFNEKNYSELNLIIKYIKNNNYQIVPIKELIKE